MICTATSHSVSKCWRRNSISFLSAKPDSHPELYQTVAYLQAQGAVEQFSERVWKGKRAEIYTYRYVNQVPLRAGADALQVNWCEMTIQHETTGKTTFRNAWATRHEITDECQRNCAGWTNPLESGE